MLSYGDLDLIATKLGSLSCKSENGDVAIQLPDKFDSYGLIFLQNTEISHSLPARLTALFLMKTTPLRFPTVQIQRQKIKFR